MWICSQGHLWTLINMPLNSTSDYLWDIGYTTVGPIWVVHLFDKSWNKCTHTHTHAHGHTHTNRHAHTQPSVSSTIQDKHQIKKRNKLINKMQTEQNLPNLSVSKEIHSSTGTIFSVCFRHWLLAALSTNNKYESLLQARVRCGCSSVSERRAAEAQ